MQHSHPKQGLSLLIILFALLGIALIWYCTVWGAGLMDDSYMYINSAQNLASGNGLRWMGGDGRLYPLTHFPPLFSIILAGMQWIGLPALSAARVVNALAFGMNLLLVGILIGRFTHWHWAVILGSLLFLSSDVLIEAHAWAMSEPLFLCLYLGSVIMMLAYLERPATKWLVGAGIFLGISFLARYVGIAFILAAMLTILLVKNIPSKRRWKDLFSFSMVSLLPVIFWVGYTIFVIGSPTDRTFDFYLITTKQILRTFNTMLAWFIPGRLVNEYEIFWLIAIAVGLFLLWFFNHKRGSSSNESSNLEYRFSIYLYLILQFICYIPIIFLSKSFFDPLTPLNNRILLPLLPVTIVSLMKILSHLWNNGGQIRRIILAVCCLGLLGMYGYRTYLLVPRLHNSGLGFARKSMHTSPMLAALRTYPETPLYSNSPYAITMWTGLPAYGIANLDDMRQHMANEGALLVVFNAVSLDLYDTNLPDLTQGLEMVNEYRDGAIYRLESQ